MLQRTGAGPPPGEETHNRAPSIDRSDRTMRLRPLAFGMLLAGSLPLAAAPALTASRDSDAAPDAPGTAEGFWVATMPSGINATWAGRR